MHLCLDTWKVSCNKKYLKPPIDYLNFTTRFKYTPSLFLHRSKIPDNLYQDFFNKQPPTTFDNVLSFFKGKVQGTLFQKDIPLASCWVNLYQSSTGLLVTRAYTNEQGFFTLNSVATDVTYYLVASDPKGVYNSVTIDGIRIDSRKDYTIDIG